MSTRTKAKEKITAEKLVMMPMYEHACVREVLTHRVDLAHRWAEIKGTVFTIEGLMAEVRMSMPGHDALKVQTLTANFPGQAGSLHARSQGGDFPWIQPIAYDGSLRNVKAGRTLCHAELLQIVAEEMEVLVKGFPRMHRFGGVVMGWEAAVFKALALTTEQATEPQAPPELMTRAKARKNALDAIAADTKRATPLITPTPAAVRELPAEQTRVGQQAVVDQIACELAVWRKAVAVYMRSQGDKKSEALALANKHLQNADAVLSEVYALGGPDEVGKVLHQVLKQCRVDLRKPWGDYPGYAGNWPAREKATPPKPAASKRKKQATNQLGLHLLDDGAMVTDPANALQELHDQVNEVKVPTMGQVAEAYRPTPMRDLVEPLGTNRREREKVKKNFSTLLRKLAHLTAAQRAAFLDHLKNLYP